MLSLAGTILKYVGVIGLLFYLVLGILRPMMRELVSAGNAAAKTRAQTGNLGEAAGEMGEVVTLGPRVHSYEEDLKLVKDMAKQDPKIVANVVKDWVNKE